jgi:hypothetical protein
MPHIAVINESTASPDADIQKMLLAFGTQWNRDLLPVWGVDAATFTFVPRGVAPASGTWWVVFLDNSDQAGDLAYHDLTSEGLPISKVFVKTILDDRGSVSVGATHEICEMAVDPWLNSAYQDRQGVFWAGEVCDPVEDDLYGYDIGGTLVTDFVTPNWFAHQHAQAAIDFKGHARAAYEILSGGYAQKYDPQRGWQQITGPRAMHSARAVDPPDGSRRERRARRVRASQDWRRSEPSWGNARAA